MIFDKYKFSIHKANFKIHTTYILLVEGVSSRLKSCPLILIGMDTLQSLVDIIIRIPFLLELEYIWQVWANEVFGGSNWIIRILLWFIAIICM